MSDPWFPEEEVKSNWYCCSVLDQNKEPCGGELVPGRSSCVKHRFRFFKFPYRRSSLAQTCRRLAQIDPPIECAKIALFEPLLIFETDKGNLRVALHLPHCHSCSSLSQASDFIGDQDQRDAIRYQAGIRGAKKVMFDNTDLRWLPLNGISWPGN